MTVFLIILMIIFSFWVMYGRGALIVYRHKKDVGVALPDGIDKDTVMETLKKELSYKDTKEIYFDELGEICITGKYGTYYARISDGKLCIDELIPDRYNTENINNSTVSFLTKAAFFGSMFNRKNARMTEELECIRAYAVKVFDHNAPVNAHKKYTNMKMFRNHSIKITAVAIALVVLLFITAIANATSNSGAVRDGYFESYSTTVSVGDAFDDYFSDPEWEDYSEGSSDYVKFTGGCTWNSKDAELTVIFKMDGDWFYIDEIYVYSDNKRETVFDEDYILSEIYGNYGK